MSDLDSLEGCDEGGSEGEEECPRCSSLNQEIRAFKEVLASRDDIERTRQQEEEQRLLEGIEEKEREIDTLQTQLLAFTRVLSALPESSDMSSAEIEARIGRAKVETASLARHLKRDRESASANTETLHALQARTPSALKNLQDPLVHTTRRFLNRITELQKENIELEARLTSGDNGNRMASVALFEYALDTMEAVLESQEKAVTALTLQTRQMKKRMRCE
eukprot:Sspe_Gene.102208::Locus_77066_Transcript_2_3_Confidence_0.333_Length_793::g.102208::m.102208